jgi:hypothetical protein
MYFVSKNLIPTELNYIVTKNEFLAIVHAINKFIHYISWYDIFVQTNHSAIRYLMKKSITNGRVSRWIFLLQEFNISILDRLRRENLVTNFLSRIHNDEQTILVDDEFTNEHFFLYLLTPRGLEMWLTIWLHGIFHNIFHLVRRRSSNAVRPALGLEGTYS